MIITGWKTRAKVLADGMFVCPVCKQAECFLQVAQTRWFTFFFMPLFPLRQLGEYVECQRCHSCFEPSVVSAATSDAAVLAAVVEQHGIADPAIFRDPNLPPATFVPTLAAPIPAAQAPTSRLALASLILGLLSPILLCICGLSAVSSLGAIVTGHLALLNIKRAGGTGDGKIQAIIGLVAGYLMMIASIGLWSQLGPAVYRAWNKDAQAAANRPKTRDDRLRDAEMRVLTVSTEGTATGNTAVARSLAAAYAEALDAMRKEMFTKQREGVSLTQGRFVVHCEAQAKSCAFIVHVPSYRNFTNDAKQELEKRAWELAEEVAAPKFGKGDRLAVGLRGTALYGAVLIGEFGGAENGILRSKRESLIDFFPENEEALPSGDK